MTGKIKRNRKVIKTLFVTLFLAIMTSCKTTEIKTVTLPPEPKRQELKELTDAENIPDLVDMLIYYETLVEKWEAWGMSVKELVE